MSIRSKLLADAIRTIADEIERGEHGRRPERVDIRLELTQVDGELGLAHSVEVAEFATTAPRAPPLLN